MKYRDLSFDTTKTPKMPCQIYLRRDQLLSHREIYSVKDRATIFAPTWVKEALRVLGQHLKGTVFEVYDNNDSNAPLTTTSQTGKAPFETFTITEDFNNQSLTVLQKIARNESFNVSGVIKKSLYSDIKDVKILYSIRDLVRQCVIVGIDECSRCGGYRCRPEQQPRQKVYICDLAALQFQQPYNTGRLILVEEDERFKGLLDDLIYEKVVGERKRSFNEVKTLLENHCLELSDRYLAQNDAGGCFLDIHAYRRFVAMDVILAGTSVSEMAANNGDKIHFKFLKYGTGFFAGKFQMVLERFILAGVLDGLEILFSKNSKVKSTIKSIELPFFKTDPQSEKRLERLNKEFKVNINISNQDALKYCQSLEGKDKCILATTNCGDNHVACGNEMGFSSVDAAISENLASKGNLLCPNINTRINEQYLEI